MTPSNSTDLTPEQIETLEDSTEDYGYLFWCVGHVRSLYPDLPYGEQKEKGQKAIHGLLSQGLIALFRGTAFAGEETELASSEWKAVLADPMQWDWEQYQDKDWADGEVQFRYGSTKQGEKVYQYDPQIGAYYQTQFWKDHHPHQWGYYRGQEVGKS